MRRRVITVNVNVLLKYEDGKKHYIELRKGKVGMR